MRKQDQVLFHYSSVKAKDDRTVIAASAGHGVWQMGAEEGAWTSMERGLPPNIHINRLQSDGDEVFACTDQGLFRLEREGWKSANMPLLCYQFKEYGEIAFAATSHGLWSRTSGGWKRSAFAQGAVYDFLYLPQFIILATDGGMALYDRLTCTWAQFPLHARITALAVLQTRLIGITDMGELVLGNRMGGFERFRFPGLFIFNMVAKGRAVYLCADRGLYRLSEIDGRSVMRSVTLGAPVTDLDIQEDRMYVATLNKGVQILDGFAVRQDD